MAATGFLLNAAVENATGLQKLLLFMRVQRGLKPDGCKGVAKSLEESSCRAEVSCWQRILSSAGCGVRAFLPVEDVISSHAPFQGLLACTHDRGVRWVHVGWVHNKRRTPLKGGRSLVLVPHPFCEFTLVFFCAHAYVHCSIIAIDTITGRMITRYKAGIASYCCRSLHVLHMLCFT